MAGAGPPSRFLRCGTHCASLLGHKEGTMLYTILVILVILIILGFVFGRGRW
jgi:1,4-dihydroxy-2-naphthoate octaprenyltransferase